MVQLERNLYQGDVQVTCPESRGPKPRGSGRAKGGTGSAQDRPRKCPRVPGTPEKNPWRSQRVPRAAA